MPELPEVETARRLVHENCSGKKILEVECADDYIVIEKVKPDEFVQALEGRTLVDVHRKGKSLWFELDQKPWPTFHFGMTGSFVVKGVQSARYRSSVIGEEDQWPPKYLKVLIKLEGGVELAFCDPRRLARVRLMQDPTTEPPISALGPDAMLELPGVDDFGALIKKRKAIKAVLLDQSVIAGIGNWVADEVLYAARLHPEAVAGQLSEAEIGRLHESVRTVLETSVEVGADSSKFPEDWLFHHRWDSRKGKKGEGPTLKGNPVQFITVGGRTSAFVPAVQGSGPQGSADKAAPPGKQPKRGSKSKPAEEEEEKQGGERGAPAKKPKRGARSKPQEDDEGSKKEEPAPVRGRKGVRKDVLKEEGGVSRGVTEEEVEATPTRASTRKARGVAKEVSEVGEKEGRGRRRGVKEELGLGKVKTKAPAKRRKRS